MEDNYCDTCGCVYLWKHTCGETCLCRVCYECDLVITGDVCVCEREGANA